MSAIHELMSLFKTLTDPDWISHNGGLYIVLAIIFAETGLFLGFFLPGDSLLFITGMMIKNTTQAPNPTNNQALNLLYWIIIITVAGIVGNLIGYAFGKKSGHLLVKNKESFFAKKMHQAHEFYEQRGGMAIFVARFVPIVRTFAPIVAGMVEMNYKKFMNYNILGCITWVVSMIITGYLLGSIEFVKKNLEIITLLIIFVTTAPVLFKMFFGRKKTTTAQ